MRAVRAIVATLLLLDVLVWLITSARWGMATEAAFDWGEFYMELPWPGSFWPIDDPVPWLANTILAGGAILLSGLCCFVFLVRPPGLGQALPGVLRSLCRGTGVIALAACGLWLGSEVWRAASQGESPYIVGILKPVLGLGIVGATLLLVARQRPVPHEEPPLNFRGVALVAVTVCSILAGYLIGVDVWQGVRVARTLRMSYFSPRANRLASGIEPWKVLWYSGDLRAMGEPSLAQPRAGVLESYRFLWLAGPRTDHTAVRIDRTSNGPALTVKVLDCAVGHDPGRKVTDRTRPLTQEQWNDFLQLLERAGFWSMPTRDSRRGLDGAEWVLEGVRGGEYHVVDRWSPEAGAFRECCAFLFKLGELDVELVP